jgi:hypothetical protein
MQDKFVTVTTGTGEEAQLSSFQNATLQSAGPRFTMSIATSLTLPSHLANSSESEIAAYVQELLTRAAFAASASKQLQFEVHIGLSRDAEDAVSLTE